jgi:MFS family permease
VCEGVRLITPARQLLTAFQFGDIRMLWISTVSNQLGQGVQLVVLGWLVFDMTGSSGMVGVIFAARAAPNLIVGLIAGSITDRVDRRTMMRVAVSGLALTSLGAGLVLSTGQLDIWQLMLVTFMLGTFQAFYVTARQVYVYDVVGASGVINAIALISLGQRLGQVFGALMAGALIYWQGAGTSFLAMSLGYGFGVMTLYMLRHAGGSAPPQRELMGENILNYFRALRTNRLMLSLMVSTAATEVFGFSHQVMLPILAKDVLLVGAVGLGVLTAFRFLGGALGVVILAALGEVRRRGLLLLSAVALFGIGQVLLGQAFNFWVALLVVAFANAMASIADVLHQSLLQLSVSNEQRGRAMGSWIVGIGTAPVGHLQVGYLAEATNARIALLINGVTLAVLALTLGVVLPRLRRL